MVGHALELDCGSRFDFRLRSLMVQDLKFGAQDLGFYLQKFRPFRLCEFWALGLRFRALGRERFALGFCCEP